jgi:hypothetical protein
VGDGLATSHWLIPPRNYRKDLAITRRTKSGLATPGN